MARLYPNGAPAVTNGAPTVTYSAADMTGRSESGINTPPEQNFNTPAMAGSMQQFLADNLGEYVIVEFLVGTQNIVQKAGILYAVGTSVLTLYEEVSQTFVTCDIFSVKFVTFFLPGHRPWQANHPLFPINGMQGIAAKTADQGGMAIPMGGCMGGTCTGY